MNNENTDRVSHVACPICGQSLCAVCGKCHPCTEHGRIK